MNCRNQWFITGAARISSRVAERCLLPSAGIACLVLALAGCGVATPFAGTPVQQEQGQKLSAPNVLFTIHDLGMLGSNKPNQPGQPIVITNSGWISGASDVGAGLHAVLWHGGTMLDIGNPGLGGNSFGYGVNDSGDSAGQAELAASGLSTTEDFCSFQFEGFTSSPTPCVPFIWAGGKMTALPTLGGVNGIATQINNRGAVAGYVENTTADSNCAAPQVYQFEPVVWFQGRIQQLPTGGDPEGVALAINDQGQVAGGSGTCGPLDPIWLWNLQPAHALLWQNGTAIDLGNLGAARNNFAHGINNRGQVVGSSGVPDSPDNDNDMDSPEAPFHAFLWPGPGNKMQDLGTVDGDQSSVGLGINDSGQVVGVSMGDDFSVVRAFLRVNGKLVDLNTLVSGTTPLYLLTACSITSKGEIIGIALDSSGNPHGYLAVPTGASAANSNVVKHPVLPDSIRERFRLLTGRLF